MRVLLVSDRDERPLDEGAVAVLVAIMLTLFMLLAAFALDIGAAYAKVRQQSVSADAAALAAAAAIGEKLKPSFSDAECQTQLTTIGAQALALSVAKSMNDKNSAGGTENITVDPVTCVTNPDGTTKSIQVTVRNNHPVKTALAGIIGIDSINANSYAVARYARVSGIGGLKPWAICSTRADDASKDPSTTFGAPLDNKVGICGTTANGNWGSVDFDGGNNSATDLKSWTESGYPGTLTVPGTFDSDPGKTASVASGGWNGIDSAFAKIIGTQALFPTATGFVDGGSGSNGKFAVDGVLTVKICGIRYAGTDFKTDVNGNASGCWTPPDETLSGSNTDIKTTTGNAPAGTTGELKVKPSAQLTVDQANVFPTDAGTVGGVTIAYSAIKVTMERGYVRKSGQSCSSNPQYSPLVIDVTSIKNATTVDLTDPIPAKNCYDVNTAKNLAVAATWTKTTTTTTPVYSGGLPYLIPSGSHTAVDHIQFRFVSFTPTTTYTGGSFCSFNDANCAGATLLWK